MSKPGFNDHPEAVVISSADGKQFGLVLSSAQARALAGWLQGDDSKWPGTDQILEDSPNGGGWLLNSISLPLDKEIRKHGLEPAKYKSQRG
jgi:hypothetical protein